MTSQKSYSKTRTKEFSKAFTVFKLKYEKRGLDDSLFKEIEKLNINKNQDFALYSESPEKIRINIRDYQKFSNEIYIFASFYHPQASISVTPKDSIPTSIPDEIDPIEVSIENIKPVDSSEMETNDLQHIERYDEAHLFLIIKDNEISAGITIAHPNSILNRTAQLLTRLGLKTTDDGKLISHSVDKSILRQIKKRGFYGVGVTTSVSTTDDQALREISRSIFNRNKSSELKPIAGETMRQADIIFTKKDNIELRKMNDEDFRDLESELNEFFYLLDSNKTKIYPREFVINMQYYCKPYGLSTIFPSTAAEILLDNIRNQNEDTK